MARGKLSGALGKKLRDAHGDISGSAATKGVSERRITSGSLTLDYALGGGVQVGFIAMFYGEKSGGKSTSASRICGIAQNLCRNCFRPARRDAWHVFEDGEQVLLGPKDPVVMARLQAHDHLVEKGYRLDATVAGEAIYGDEAGEKTARVVRLPGGVEAVPPSEEDLADDPGARWSAQGHCTCFAEGLYVIPEPPRVTSEKQKEYEARVARWRAELTANSYEEFVVIWMDTEGALVKKWAERLGVDLRRLFYIRPTNAEEAIDIGHAIALSGQADLWVIDSIAMLVPQKELTASTEEWQQGLQARLVNKAARKIISAQNVQENAERPLTQIWINQTRDKIGVMWGDPSVKPGGKGQDFAIHAEIKFMASKRKTIEDQYGSKDESLTVGIEETFKFKTTKNRTEATNGVEWFYVQLMRANDRGPAGTVVEDELIFKLAMRHLVITDKKKNTYTLGDQVFESQKELLVRLREDAEFRAVIKEVLLRHMIEAPASSFVGKAADDEKK